MNKMLFNTFDKKRFSFQLDLGNQMQVSFDIDLINGGYRIMYNAYIKEFGSVWWELKDGIFRPKNEDLTTDVLEKVNNGFYELVSQIKHHPEVRLLMLRMLESEFRKVWEIA